jgi:acetyl esterase
MAARMTKPSPRPLTCVFGLSAALAASACQSSTEPGREAPQPTQPTPAPVAVNEPRVGTPAAAPSRDERVNVSGTAHAKDVMEEADSDMKDVLTELGSLGAASFSTLTPAVARKQPTPADAVKKILEKKKKPTTLLEMAKVEDRKFPGAKGQLAARIYTPKTDDEKPLPVIAYWHGGGFVVADLDVYDASPRALADEADAIVVSLDYRRAPESKFPAAHDDAFAGYQWVLKNAASFGGDPRRVAVAGESAGGNLAANVSIKARDRKVQMPVHQLLVYPVAQTGTSTESYTEWADAKPLDKASMGWFVTNYTTKPSDTNDTRLNLVNAKLEGLPKTTIILAEIDPLRSDGEMLAEKLKAAGVDVDTKTYDGVTHEFFGMGAVVGDAKDAEEYAGDRLGDAFEK